MLVVYSSVESSGRERGRRRQNKRRSIHPFQGHPTPPEGPNGHDRSRIIGSHLPVVKLPWEPMQPRRNRVILVQPVHQPIEPSSGLLDSQADVEIRLLRL